MNKKNETIDLINERRTIRAYSSQKLTEEEINTIIHSAIRAPTAGNMMFYSIIQVKDQEMKEKLVKTCDNQSFIAKAPLVLLFLADVQRWWDYFKISNIADQCEKENIEYQTPQESDLLLASCDALIAAQSAVIGAEALGIGSCYIGDIMENYEDHREMFNLPRWVFPITLICFGYPKGDKEKIPLTPRFPEKYIHFINQYERLNPEDFSEMVKNDLRIKQLKEGESLAQLAYFKKLAADYSIEMRRSVKVALNEWTAKE
ncbi:MAG: nitroreductase family protein [Promethearchaeota archaeon]